MRQIQQKNNIKNKKVNNIKIIKKQKEKHMNQTQQANQPHTHKQQ